MKFIEKIGYDQSRNDHILHPVYNFKMYPYKQQSHCKIKPQQFLQIGIKSMLFFILIP